ncbi:MAG: hypothetical protein AB7F40_11685 [Victivallaceae bacterium]|nr:hypothetical protein [Victivallaceae bacterium]
MKFDIFPRVFPAHRRTILTLRSAQDLPLPDGLVLQYVREDGADPAGHYLIDHPYAGIPAEKHGNSLEITIESDGEYEHYIMPSLRGAGGKLVILEKISVYSLEGDLFALRPWRGDFHMHSHCSDGELTPACVAARCRRKGMDFMALTDHRLYGPSLEAVAAMRELPTDLECFPGEEVHAGRPHVVSFGASHGITDYCRDNPGDFTTRVGRIAGTLPGGLLEHDREQIAITEAVFELVREAGGLAVYCHPYWRIGGDRFFITRPMIEQLMRRRNYDAMEAVSGFHRCEWEQNALSTAAYARMAAEGVEVNPVGVSDAHGYEPDSDRFESFQWYSTIVFAPSCRFADIAAAIRSGRCLALEALPGGEPRLTGNFRYLKLAYFLLREFFPTHDALCRTEGNRLECAISCGGREKMIPLLERDRGAVAAWRQKFFGE